MRDPERLARFYVEATKLAAAENLEGVLQRVVRAGRSLTGAELATLTRDEDGSSDGGRVFSAGCATNGATSLEFPIVVDGGRYATLRLETSRASFLTVEQALAELLCVHAALAIEKAALRDKEEVLGRVQSALGVLARTAGDATVREVGDIRLDLARYQAFVAGAAVHLTPSEFRLLELLMEEPGRAYTRYEIVSRLWGTEYAASFRTADIHVARLRHKIEADPLHPERLETVRGIGYRLREK